MPLHYYSTIFVYLLFNFHMQFQMPNSGHLCLACGAAGEGPHFGVESCRACAAFFRRAVIKKEGMYICKKNSSCKIQSRIRLMCRACRFKKCLDAGMKASSVQRFRDSLGKRSLETRRNNFEVHSQLPNSSEEISTELDLAILNRIGQRYIQLEEARRVIHNRGDIFQVANPRAMSLQEVNISLLAELPAVITWIKSSFPELASLELSQMMILFRNFYLPFMLIESGYRAGVIDRSDIITLPTGNFIDTTCPASFYLVNIDWRYNMTDEEILKLFEHSHCLYRRNILEPMRLMKFSLEELFALGGLLLWDPGLFGQSEECIEVVKKVRKRIMEELNTYLKLKDMNHPLRMSHILGLLPGIQRSIQRFQEDVSISRVFKMYNVEELFYEVTP